ncbi:hypothetical protein AAMO2058_001187700 [Amorphochlora amoebiformis]
MKEIKEELMPISKPRPFNPPQIPRSLRSVMVQTEPDMREEEMEKDVAEKYSETREIQGSEDVDTGYLGAIGNPPAIVFKKLSVDYNDVDIPNSWLWARPRHNNPRTIDSSTEWGYSAVSDNKHCG